MFSGHLRVRAHSRIHVNSAQAAKHAPATTVGGSALRDAPSHASAGNYHSKTEAGNCGGGGHKSSTPSILLLPSPRPRFDGIASTGNTSVISWDGSGVAAAAAAAAEVPVAAVAAPVAAEAAAEAEAHPSIQTMARYWLVAAVVLLAAALAGDVCEMHDLTSM
jgi:hypothetical protein